MPPPKALVAGLGVLALTATTAAAEIACNREGDCRHIKERYDFKPEFGVAVHPDNWKWAEAEGRRFRWREHEGRGYWRNGNLISLLSR